MLKVSSDLETRKAAGSSFFSKKKIGGEIKQGSWLKLYR